jgi:hypothetical protein
MRKYIAIWVAVLTAMNIYAKEIKSDETVTVTGKLGSYTDKEDGFQITITSNDVVVQRNPAEWYQNVPKVLPVKRVAIFLSDKDPRFKELKKGASDGKTVTLRGSFRQWDRHVKLGRPDVLCFELAP